MSANLDLVRSILASWERGDFGRADWAHPEIEYVFVDGPEPGSWTGMVAMEKAWRGWLSAWENVRINAEESRELDGERILVLSSYTGRGKRSGLEVGQVRAEAAMLFNVRNDKVTRFVGYWDRNRAFADLGLAPEGG
jgi:ketosteroid isomerase-like protein